MANSESNAGRFLKHSTIYAIGNVSRQMVGFLMLPLYTRFLTPADYGVVGLLTFALALLEPFFGARLGDAMMKFYYEAKDDAQRRIVISTTLMVTGMVSTVVASVAFACRVSVSKLIFGTPEYAVPVGLLSYVFLSQAIEYYGLTFLRIQQRPVTFVIVNLSKLVIQVCMNTYLVVYLKQGVTGVALTSVVSSGLYAAGLGIYTIYYNGMKWDLGIARRMIVFSWPLLLSSLASLYIFSANRYYIRIFSSMDQVGYYELAARFAAILGLVIWQPFAQFWETERFRHWRKPEAGAIFGSVFEFASTMQVLGALGISIFSEPVINLMSAPAFHQAARLVPWLSFAWMFGNLAIFTTFSFLATEKTGQITRNSYITVAIVTVLNLLLIPKFGYIGAGIAQFLALFTAFLLLRRAARPLFDMRLRLAPLFAMLAVACVSYVAANVVIHFASVWVDLLWKVVIYAISSALIIRVLLRSAPNKAQVMRLLDAMIFPLMRRLRLLPHS
jgi:O-antigen/teichoic acid export membrane protein